MTAANPPAAPSTRGAFEIVLLFALATLWSASYTFIKVGVETIPPVTLILGRTGIAGLVLLAAIFALGIRLPRDRRAWASFAVQACLNSVLPFTVIAWAEQTVDAGLATILNSTSPIFVFLLALVLNLPGERGLAKFVGVALGFLGIVLVIGADALKGFSLELAGQLAIVAATISYAGAAVWGRRFGEYHPLVPAAGSMITGALILLPVSLVFEQPWTLAPSRDSLLALAGLSLLSTALAFALYFRLLRTLGSVGVSSQAFLRVPIGVGIAALVLGESLPATAWAGMACVVAGVAAMTLRPRRP